MKLSLSIALAGLVTPLIATADINISNHCQVNIDCSATFEALAVQANSTREKLIIDQNTQLDYVNLEVKNISYLNILGTNNSIIKAGILNFKNIKSISISGLEIDGENLSSGYLIAVDGATDGVTFTNNNIHHSAGDLLNIGNSQSINISGNDFSYSGTTRDYHAPGVTKGNGLIVWNTTGGNISSNNFLDIWQVGIFLKESTSNINVTSNVLDTIYDNGIRVQSDANWFGISDITIDSNTITGVNIDAIRINGDNMKVLNNTIDGRETGTNIITTSVGIKSEGLINSEINGNNISHSFTGIAISSRYDKLNNVTINYNVIDDTNKAFAATSETYTYTMDNLTILHNEFYNTSNDVDEVYYNDAWVVQIFGNINQTNAGVNFHSNTITNRNKGNRFEHYVVRLKNLYNPYIGNNYIDGTAKYSYIQAVNLNLADFNGSRFISRHESFFPWGGVRLDSSNNVLFRNNRFDNVCPSVVDINGTNNTITNTIEVPLCN